jgi:hypothetical protein
MGGAVSAGQNNEELVDNLCREGYIHEPRVEKVALISLITSAIDIKYVSSKDFGVRLPQLVLATYWLSVNLKPNA